MKYVVIHSFLDEQDGNHAYHEGDTFPRDGVFASDLRIKDLMNGNNPHKMQLIKIGNGIATFINKKVVEEIKEENPIDEVKEEISIDEEPSVEDTPAQSEFTAEEIDKMPFMKLKSVARKNGVQVEDKEAKDIRSDLKKELGV